MKKKLNKLFRKVRNKMFRRKSCRTFWEQKFDSTIGHNNVQINAASFKRMFEAAYPDAAKFMDAIKEMPVSYPVSRFGADEDNVTFIVANASIVYENGANVKTGFITNCMPGGLRISVRGDLREVIERVQKERKRDKRALPVYDYPAHVVSAALLQKIAQPGIVLDFPKEECEYVRTLDAQRKAGKSIFGNGFFISERLAAERMAAERMAEREKYIWELSERERMIIKRLSGNP